MALRTPSSPHIHAGTSVTRVMLQVVAATLPGVLVYAWLFGPGPLVNIALAVSLALGLEAAMLALRGRPLRPFLTDGSVVVTGLLFALALPQLTPWWITALGIAFAVVVGKHLFGGLGHNPFNPAMVGYVMLLISFPREMSAWQPPQALAPHPFDLAETLRYVFTGALPAGLDALSGATPLDTVRTQLSLERALPEILQGPLFGQLAGAGWEWVNLAFLAGGLWLVARRIAAWQIPAGMLAALALLAAVFHLVDPDRYASPLFHLLSGATMLGAFFIATDPVTAATTPLGRLCFGVGVGVLTYVIRTWGGYPDGVAFAVLLMNLAAPLLDHYTRPRVYGHGRR